jgi:hypothetical protein
MADAPLGKQQQAEFNDLLYLATISAGLPFSWVDNPEVRRAFAFLRKAASIPGREELATTIHNRVVSRLEEATAAELQEIGGGTLQ